MKEHIGKLNLSNKVKLMGTNDCLEKEIYDAGIFVLSSDYEGMPNALMEAMSLGLPCISTDCPCGGPNFLIDNNKNGILIPVNDKSALVESLEKLIEDKDFSKKLSGNAIKISSKYNTEKINKMWNFFINEVMKNEY